jgi:ASC-1-like (ASCH) protein
MKNNTLDLTVIIPINKLENDLDKNLFAESIKSIHNQIDNIAPKEIIIVTNDETSKSIDLKEYKSARFVINNETFDNVQSQINKAVKEVKTSFFMVLDSDDEITNFYFKNVAMHMEEMPNVDMFLSLIADVTLDKKIHRYINEINWAKDMTNDRHGYLTMETLMNYNLVSINGAVIRKEKFEESGGLKESMKLSFVYEFLMRFTNIDGITYTVPKIGYLRKMGRENSYLAQQADMEGDEVNFWWNLAKKEYVWPHDRNKSYVKKQEAPII